MWNDWGASQRDLLILNTRGDLVFHENITSAIPSDLESFIIDLLTETTIYVASTGSDENGDGSEFNPYATIQKGVESANDENIVMVGAGVYLGPVEINKEIFLVSQAGPSETVIDGNCPYVHCNAITSFDSDGPVSLKISGFTITGGKEFYDDEGAGWVGGAIGPIYDLWFVDSLILEDMIFIDNQDSDVSIGSSENTNYLEIKNSTFIKNEGKIFHSPGSQWFSHTISSSIFFSEQANNQDDYVSNFSNCLIYGGVSFPGLGANNNNLLDIDPLFCDPENGDYSLAENSPAIGAGVAGVNIGALGIGCDAFETAIYVTTNGSDGTGDGSEQNPYATIQKGINESSDGDTVFVAEGTYEENINYNGKNISIIGESRETTIIDGSQNGSVVTFENGENETALLKHFMITNSGGLSNDWGGGVYVRGGSTPFLDNLIIDGNEGGGSYGDDGGGGLCVIDNGSRAEISNSIISNTTSESESGALFACVGGQIKATNCVIVNNNTIGVSAGCNSGGGDNFIELINCTITDNNSAGIYIFGDVSVSNSIIVNNGWDGNQNIGEADNGTIYVINSLIQGGYDGTGNIDGDPLFCDPENGDYSLAENSPAVGAGEGGVNMGAFGVGCSRIAQTIHVSTVGSDETGDGSEDNPYATIAFAQQNVAEFFDPNYINPLMYWSGYTITDTILVHPGFYEEPYLVNNNNNEYYTDQLTIITSLNGPSETTINGTTIGATLSSYDISGFTIKNSSFNPFGSFIYLQDCVVMGSESISSSSCPFENSCFGFFNNTWIENNGEYNFDDPPIFNNSMLFNNAGFIDNSGELDIEIDFISFSLNDLGLNENGNIADLNPLFCDPENEDYSLAENSPAVGAGEDGVDMGALGVGCEAIELAPIISEIDDQQINEDGSISLEVSATSEIGAAMTFTALSDTSDVVLALNNSTLTANPTHDWNGIANIMVIVTDENDLSDSTSFTLNVSPVNDSPEDFNVLYPTASDTFSTHMGSDTAIAFSWEESNDIDSDITYTLTIEFEFFGNVYSDVHESIEDTIFSVSSNSLNPILDATAQDIAVFNYYVHSTDGDFVVLSSLGEFVLSRESLSISDAHQVPMAYTLYQNYPNPFNPTTKIKYDLPKDQIVTIAIYDVMGRNIRTFMNISQTAGYHSIHWDAKNDIGEGVAAGMYIYTIQAGEFRATKKMVLLK